MIQRTCRLVLAGLLGLLGLGGLYGGAAMLADPSGRLIQLDMVLPLLPVPDYRLPGAFLLVAMGLLPLGLAYGAARLPQWRWANALTAWSGQHWAWLGAMALAVALMLWLAIQALLIGFRWPIQYITMANGILIMLVALLPISQRSMALDREPEAL